MADGSRIPRGIDGFNLYLITTCAFLMAGMPSNAERLGILPDEAAKWQAFLAEWTPLYAKYSDKKNGRTTAVKDQLLDIIDRCVILDQTSHILDRIAASPNVTIVDMETFNIKKGVLQKGTRSTSTTPLSESVNASLQMLGGGSFAVKCHNSTSRASIVEGSDSVQYAYLIGTTPPESVKAPGLIKDLSTKAAFTLALGPENTGKYLYIYFRWNNTKHPELAGPWSTLITVLIA